MSAPVQPVRGRHEWKSAVTGEEKRLNWILAPAPGGLCQLSELLYRPAARQWWEKGTVVLSWEAACALADAVNKAREGSAGE